jgi:predicted nucleic acid-binding protein
MSLVVDPSVALAWVYSDEGGHAIDRVLDQVVQTGAWVPVIWRLEVANSLEYSVRRRRIDRSMRDFALSKLGSLNITADPETNVYAWTATLAFAERFRLTLYDAAYIELAQRRALPLASLDDDMRAAAASLAIPLLGL